MNEKWKDLNSNIENYIRMTEQEPPVTPINNFMSTQTYWYFNDDHYITFGISIIGAALFILGSILVIRKYRNVMQGQIKKIILMYMSIMVMMVFSQYGFGVLRYCNQDSGRRIQLIINGIDE